MPQSVGSLGKLLIVRLGAFGDILHTLPLAANCHEAGWQISWLCEDRWAQVLEGSPVIHEVIPLPRKRLRQGTLAQRYRLMAGLCRELRHREFTAVIDAQGLAKSSLWAQACGAPIKVAHGGQRAREGTWLLPRRRIPPSATHVIDQQRSLGLGLNVHAQGGWRFPLPAWPDAHSFAHTWLDAQGLRKPWLINVGAGWPTKVWPEERLSELTALLSQRGDQVLLLWGSPKEEEAAQRILGAAGAGYIAPWTTLPQLAAFISRGRILISGDTGPLHMGLAVGTPTVGLFGPVPKERNGPRGHRHENLQAPGAAWERKDVSKVNMGALSAQAVLECADGLLKNIGHQP